MVVVLERQLHAVKINEGDAVQGAFDQLRDLYVKLSATGVDYPENIKCYKALSLLPESWGPLVVNLNGMKDSWSLEWIRAEVVQEEFRRKELIAAAGEGGGSAYGMKGFKGRGSKKGKANEGSGGEQYSGGKRSNKGGKRCGGKCWDEDGDDDTGDSSVARGAAFGGAASGSAEPGGAELGGAESVSVEPRGAEPEGVEPGGAESEGAESGGAEPGGTSSSGDPTAAEAGDAVAGDTGAGGVGGTRFGGAGVTAGVGGTGGASPGGAHTSGTGSARSGSVGGAGAGGSGAGDPAESRGARAGGTGAGGVGAGGAGAVDPGAGGAGAGGAVSGSTGAGGTVRPRPNFVPLLQQPASPLPAPSPYTEQTGGLKESLEPESRLASPVRDVRTARRVPRPCPPPVPGTNAMALRPSSIPLRSQCLRLLANVVTDPESTAASAPLAELADFAAICRLHYATNLVAQSASASPPSVASECALGSDVLEDRQEDFDCLAPAVPRFSSMMLAPEGDPDAPDIPTPRSYAEAITTPYSSQWQTAMDAKMASWKSTGTYVDALPPSGANIVDGMWIFRVKRPPGSPPVFKARYVP
ncbi:unnamed protein product [Closterium sp. NIES-54]